MNNKAICTIEKYSMLKKGDNVVIGFSGGADSSALLDFLYSISYEYNLKLIPCHINHNIRGKEAMNDQHFCEQFCKNRGLNLEVKSIDVPKISKERNQSMELCARDLRYQIFHELMKRYSALLATAHTMSDNAETVIWNMTRGTGLKGLCGIPPIRDKKIIRPLIECTRTEIENYCNKRCINYVTDSTNLENEYTRNKIRNLIIPVMKNLNVSVESTIGRMNNIIRNENDFMDSYTRKVLKECRIREGFERDKIINVHPAILSRVLAYIIEEFKGEPTYKTVEILSNIVLEGHGAINISKNNIIEIVNGIIQLRKPRSALSYFEKKLQIGEVSLNKDKKLNIYLVNYQEYKKIINFSKDVLKKSLDYDKILYDACIRQKCDGDKISLAGRNHTKSIKKLFNEASLSLDERSRRVVICDSGGVIFLEGFGCDKRVQVGKDSKRVLVIEDIPQHL